VLKCFLTDPEAGDLIACHRAVQHVKQVSGDGQA
jgi:hypothetical protein